MVYEEVICEKRHEARKAMLKNLTPKEEANILNKDRAVKTRARLESKIQILEEQFRGMTVIV